MWLSGKEPTFSAGDTGGLGSIPRLGRSPGKGNGNPLQYSCFLPGESHEQRSLVGYSPWGRKESDKTEATYLAHAHMILLNLERWKNNVKKKILKITSERYFLSIPGQN